MGTASGLYLGMSVVHTCYAAPQHVPLALEAPLPDSTGSKTRNVLYQLEALSAEWYSTPSHSPLSSTDVPMPGLLSASKKALLIACQYERSLAQHGQTLQGAHNDPRTLSGLLIGT